MKQLKTEPFIPHRTLLATSLISKPDERLLITDDKGSHLSVRSLATGESFLVSRMDITVPTVVCVTCGTPLVNRRNGKVAFCPHYYHHLYENFYALSHDVKLTRKARRMQEHKAQKFKALMLKENKLHDQVENIS